MSCKFHIWFINVSYLEHIIVKSYILSTYMFHIFYMKIIVFHLYFILITERRPICVVYAHICEIYVPIWKRPLSYNTFIYANIYLLYACLNAYKMYIGFIYQLLSSYNFPIKIEFNFLNEIYM